jgi:putative ABC transport system permease protein
MSLISINIKSILNRRFTVILTILSLAISVALFFGITDINNSARKSFTDSISKTDLIVGEKTGPINLLLYSVFHMGSAINNIKYSAYQDIKRNPQVAWTIPISLGDSYKNHRVVATDKNFFKHYHFQSDKKLSFSKGREFSKIGEVVIGSAVARKLNIKIGDKLNVTHGITGGLEEQVHDHLNFTVVGILNTTATPVDRALYLSLQSMEAIHDPEYTEGKVYEIDQITSFLVGAKSRLFTLFLQRSISQYKNAPLMAVIPGVVLNNLWSIIGQAQTALTIVTYTILIISFFTLVIGIYNQLNERRREMAIFRSQGMSGISILFLLLSESIIMAATSFVCGVLLKIISLNLIKGHLFENFSINMTQTFNFSYTSKIFVVYMFVAFLMGLIPAVKAYRNSVRDGLNINI